MKPCTTCLATGFIDRQTIAMRQCPVCNGTGSVPTDTNKECSTPADTDKNEPELSVTDTSKDECTGSFGHHWLIGTNKSYAWCTECNRKKPTPDQPQADKPTCPYCGKKTVSLPAHEYVHEAQADEDSARRRQEFADAGIYPDTDELERIVEDAYAGEISWIHDQLDGTSFAKDEFERVHKDKLEAIARIQSLITREREQAKREALKSFAYQLTLVPELHTHAIIEAITVQLEAAFAPNEPKEAE